MSPRMALEARLLCLATEPSAVHLNLLRSTFIGHVKSSLAACWLSGKQRCEGGNLHGCS